MKLALKKYEIVGRRMNILKLIYMKLGRIQNELRTSVKASLVQLLIKYETMETLIKGLEFLDEIPIRIQTDNLAYINSFNAFRSFINSMTNNSKQLRRQFHEKNGTKVLISYSI